MLAGANLFLSPGWCILEGCNQVRQIYGFRLVQGILVRVVLWSAMLLGGGLWALVLERGVLFLLTGLFFLFRYARFFLDLMRWATREQAFWKKEIWPLQWRFALVWISGFLPSALIIPVLFSCQGPVAAGRIGMTWALVSALMSCSHAIVSTRMPRFAILVARKEYGELDRGFHHALRSAMLVVGAGSLAVLAGIRLLDALEQPLAERFLPFMPTLLFLVAVFLQQVRAAFGTYLRAHKREPYLVLSVVEAVLFTGMVFPLGRWYGATGIAAGFAVVAFLTFIPSLVIFRRCRRAWHDDATG
jgi:O-antigen/teichoic acid export membrane protein